MQTINYKLQIQLIFIIFLFIFPILAYGETEPQLEERLSQEKEETNTDSEPSQEEEIDTNGEPPQQEERYIYKNIDYEFFYGSLGLSVAGAFSGDGYEEVISVEGNVQGHWRFNRWIGVYINFDLLVGTGKLQSVVNNKTEGADIGLMVGGGFDFYVTDNILLFGEANGGFFLATYLAIADGGFGLGGNVKGGIAFQIYSPNLRFDIFGEKFFVKFVSGDNAFVGAGVHCFF